MKRFLGTLLALGAMALMTVGVQAATYSVTGASVSEAVDNVVSLSVQVTPDNGEADATVNGYVIALTYDADQVTPEVVDATNTDSQYAKAGDSFTDGVLVSDTVTNSKGDTTLVVAWASATPVTVSEATAMADVEFNVSTTTADSTVEVEVIELTSDGSVLVEEGGYTVNSAEISLTSIIYGDADDDGKITSNDAEQTTVWAGVGSGYTELQKTAVDVDNDGIISSNDADWITQKVGLGDSIVFPVEQ